MQGESDFVQIDGKTTAEVGAVEGGAFSVFGDLLLRRACVGVFMCVWWLAMSAPLQLFLSFFVCPQKKSQKPKREGSTSKKYVQD